MHLRSPRPSLPLCATQWHTNATYTRSRDCVGHMGGSRPTRMGAGMCERRLERVSRGAGHTVVAETHRHAARRHLICHHHPPHPSPVLHRVPMTSPADLVWQLHNPALPITATRAPCSLTFSFSGQGGLNLRSRPRSSPCGPLGVSSPRCSRGTASASTPRSCVSAAAPCRVPWPRCSCPSPPCACCSHGSAPRASSSPVVNPTECMTIAGTPANLRAFNDEVRHAHPGAR